MKMKSFPSAPDFFSEVYLCMQSFLGRNLLEVCKVNLLASSEKVRYCLFVWELESLKKLDEKEL